MRNDELKRRIELEMPNGQVETVRTVQDALRWIERHADKSDPNWTRAWRALSEAKSDGSLRKLRSATRAFEDTVRCPSRAYGRVDCKRS